MSVQAQLDAPGRIATDLQEQRTEVFIVDIEVIVVYVDRFVTVKLELSVDLPAVEGLRFLLRHPDEDDRIPPLALAAELVGNVVFSLFVLEPIHRNPFLFRQCFDCLAKLLRDLPQHYRRGNGLAQLFPQEEHQAGSGCQLADVTVQIEPVETLHFQRDVPVE